VRVVVDGQSTRELDVMASTVGVTNGLVDSLAARFG
jgi:hypothetical protein